MTRAMRLAGIELSISRRAGSSGGHDDGLHVALVPRKSDAQAFVDDVAAAAAQYPALVDGVDLSLPLAEQVASVTWYHTIELPGGVVTPGSFDHRPLVDRYGLPADLTGQRVLDIGSWDGFWTFELERRGAEVIALDVGRLSAVDLPTTRRDALKASGVDLRIGEGFRVAHEALGSTAERVVGNVYDLDPDQLGLFDLVHFGDVLEHLRDPVGALQQIRRVVRGRAHISDIFVSTPEDRGGNGPLLRYRGGWENSVWWELSLRGFGQMIVDAGFGDVELVGTYELARTAGGPPATHAVWSAKP